MARRLATKPTKDTLITGTFVLVSGIQFVQSLSVHLYLHVPGFFHGLGADEVQIGFLFSVMAASAVAARPVIGRVMDTRGRRLVLLVAGAVNVVVCLAYLAIGSLGPALTVLRLVHGLVEAALFAGLFTYAADIVPASRRTEGLAIFGVFGLLPLAVGGAIGDFVLRRGNYHDLFMVAAGLAVLAVLATFPLPERRPTGTDLAPSRGFLAVSVQRDLLPLWLVGFVFATALSAVFVFIKTYVLTTGHSSVGGFMTAYALSASLLRLAFSWVPDRYGPKRSLFPALAIMSIGLVMLGRATSTSEVLTAGVLTGLGHGFTFPIVAGLVVSRASASERGSALSMFTALFDMGMLVGGPAFGLLIQRAGYSIAYYSAAALIACGALGFALTDRR